ncbi:MAG: molybdenum cofactor guanylyltransferase [Oscillospiraceae bacterium]|nr:molybdenum cofactor guanylyltransferase [Oscillospiraceae bacterium]
MIDTTPILILAGGKSSRMGRDKLALTVTPDGESLLRRAARRFSEHFSRVYVSVGERETENVGLPTIRDVFPNCGPISGLHAALTTLGCGVFLVAADMPFANPELAKRIIEQSHGYDVTCAGTEENVEPLFAYYAASVLPRVETAIAAERYSLSREVLRRVNTLYIPIPNEGLANVNTPDELEKARNAANSEIFNLTNE